MKKTLLVLLFSTAIFSQANSKACGCTEGRVSYHWFVGDKEACSSATGSAEKVTNYGSYSVRETISAKDAIAAC